MLGALLAGHEFGSYGADLVKGLDNVCFVPGFLFRPVLCEQVVSFVVGLRLGIVISSRLVSQFDPLEHLVVGLFVLFSDQFEVSHYENILQLLNILLFAHVLHLGDFVGRL